MSIAIVSVPGGRVLGYPHFRRAALMWVRALCDPAHGLETLTEQEVEGLGGDAEALGAMPDALQPYAPEAATLCTRGCNRTCAGAMLDALLQENGCLRGGVAAIDSERLAEACVGFGTDDTKLIATICSRNKQHLGTQIYYAELHVLWLYLLRPYLLRLHLQVWSRRSTTLSMRSHSPSS